MKTLPASVLRFWLAGIFVFSSLHLFGQPPVANFSASRTTTCVGVPVNFTDQTTNLVNPVTWTWTFEGGTPANSNAQDPSGIVYGTAGRYDVTLSVTTGNGMNVITMTDMIRVIDCKPSKGIYRIPYADGTMVRVTRDHQTHSPSPNRIDMVGTGGTAPYQIVAAADGWIRMIVDNNLACCNSVGGCSDCNNYVWIEHPNGEWTKYTHFITGTVTGANFANLSINQFVCAGTYLGDEGDVGASSGSGRAAFACGGSTVIQNALDSINNVRVNNNMDSLRCGVHLHFEVGVPDDPSNPFDTLGGFLNGQNRIPIICGIPDGVFVSNTIYTAGDCETDACMDDLLLENQTFNLADVQHFQADNTITAQNNFTINAGASIVMNAGDRITLKPGFRANSNAYFHAHIKGCNFPQSNLCNNDALLAPPNSTSLPPVNMPRDLTFDRNRILHFPNPFNSNISFVFNVQESAFVNLTIYTIYGKMVAKILDNVYHEKGINSQIDFDGSFLTTGTYVYVFNSGIHTEVHKIVKVD